MKINKDRILGFIGIAKKAGKLVSGNYICEKMIISQKLELLIIAEDAMVSTGTKFKDLCLMNNVKCIEFSTKEQLGRFVGKDIRALIGILDFGFAKRIIEMIEESKLG